MNISSWGIKKIIMLLILTSLIGTVSASHYLGVSNTIRDEVDVIPSDDRIPLEVSYVPGEGLGGENKTLEEGTWEEFEIELKNDSPESAEPWENVFLWVNFYGVEDESISGAYKIDNTWENSRVYDLRTVEPGEVGGIIEFGPEGGWTFPSDTERKLRLRVKIGSPVKDAKVKIRAVVEGDETRGARDNLRDPRSNSVLDPEKSSYVHQSHNKKNYGSTEHLEVATKENSNAYTLLEFDTSEVSDEFDEARLKLYQYWGANYSELRSSGVSLQIFRVSENWAEERVTWENKPEIENSLIAEREIGKVEEWYSFDLSSHIRSLGEGEEISLLIKLGQDSFDSKERRIRFSGQGSPRPPYLSVE